MSKISLVLATTVTLCSANMGAWGQPPSRPFDPARLERRLNILQDQVQQQSRRLQAMAEKLDKQQPPPRPVGPEPAELEQRLNALQGQMEQQTVKLQQATEGLDKQSKRVAGFTASQQSTRDALDRQVREASPTGMIVAFFSKDCPPGWQAADGSGQVLDLRNRFVRGAGDQVALGQFYPGTDFEVESSAACRSPAGCGGVNPRNWTFFMQKQRINLRQTDKGDFAWASPMQDITPSTGRSGNFRPDNVGLLYCIKARS
jgi:hypothetical protein